MNRRKLYKELDKLYYDPSNSGSFGGVSRLLASAKRIGLKVKKSIVESYLSAQASYSLHKPARKNFNRNPTVVGGIDHQWQADLADMQSISSENNGMNYILSVIDVFRKFAWPIAVKNKGEIAMLDGFKKLFALSDPPLPKRLQTDAGKEFLNKIVQRYLKEKGVHHFVSHSDKKAAVVERFNRTLKTRIWMYFTANQTTTYVDKTR